MWKIVATLILVSSCALSAEISPSYTHVQETPQPRTDQRIERRASEEKYGESRQEANGSGYPSDQPIPNEESQGGYAYTIPTQSADGAIMPGRDYAPNYNYDPNYSQNGPYDYAPAPYYPAEPEPMPSTLSLLWRTVPDARTIVTYVGRSAAWILSSLTVLSFGALLAIATCSLTEICSFTYNNIGFGPLREEMRSFMTSDRLNTAADIVKNAIDKYQKIQKVYTNAKQRK